jgi:hypothetical protein
MALWEFILRETDTGRDNHNGEHNGQTYKDRRILALLKAGRSGVTVQQAPADQAPDGNRHGRFYWLVDDQSVGGTNVKALCCYFESQNSVKTEQGYPRPRGGANQHLDCNDAQIKEGVARLNDISKAIGD